MLDIFLLFLTLSAMITAFIMGIWRYDVVALAGLIALVVLGVVPAPQAFTGFSNPAVITVACVMIITQAITQTGLVDHIVKRLMPTTQNEIAHIGCLTLIAALLSAFMNNVGALALMMPVAIESARHAKRSPSLVLMPLAFGSVMGGLTTAIGTPPNLLISAYRQEVSGVAFSMFDFSPVGIAVAMAGILFISIFGWRLIPERQKASKKGDDLYHMQDYITEVQIPDESKLIGKTRQDLEQLAEGDVIIIGLVRNKRRQIAIAPSKEIHGGDILIVEAGHDALQQFLDTTKAELVGGENISPEGLHSEDIGLMEAVVTQGSRLEGRSWQRLRLRSRMRLNLLAIARQGRPFKDRLNHVSLRAGDVLLVQGDNEYLRENIVNLGLLPLLERGVQIGFRRQALIPLGIFAIAILLAGTRLLPVNIAFSLAVLMLVFFNVLPVRKLYDSIDWSVIVLLGAMIPIGEALQTSGATEYIARGFVAIAGHGPHFLIIGLLLIVTMTLSDIMNNAATAVVMAPIAVSIAQVMKVSIDPFLMTVAVGASCSFLTPISHQNNTLVMGPGGYRFGDYMRLGLPVEAIVLVIALPMILWIWPF
jgi:di/tricarboxylate transporter